MVSYSTPKGQPLIKASLKKKNTTHFINIKIRAKAQRKLQAGNVGAH